MSHFQFDESGKVWFPSEFDGRVSLNKETWEKHILGDHPERSHLQFNTEKIATTLVVPDFVRESKKDDKVHIYYKEFPTYELFQGITVPCPQFLKYLAVLVDTRTNSVFTIYGAKKIKDGEQIKGD